MVAALAIAEILHRRGGRAVYLAPTRPLVVQAGRFLQRVLAVEPIVFCTGRTPPDRRAELWKAAKVYVSTPQSLQNDVLRGAISLSNVSILVLDEAHRAVGEYPYVYIVQRTLSENPAARVLGLTASPGEDKARILTVLRNLGGARLEFRSWNHPSVRPYVARLRLEWRVLNFPPELKQVHELLKSYVRFLLEQLQGLGLFTEVRSVEELSLRRILEAREELLQHQGEQSLREVRRALLLAIEGVTALQRFEAGELPALLDFLRSCEERAQTRRGAVYRFMSDVRIRAAYTLARELAARGIKGPKTEALRAIVKEIVSRGRGRVLVFTGFRAVARTLDQELRQLPGVRSAVLIGQAARPGEPGLSQKQQVAVLDKFRSGEVNILVATQVGEEGLDVAECDWVIFFDSPLSARRYIQRRGRTARRRMGTVVCLVVRGTRDERLYYRAIRRERRMWRLLKEISKGLQQQRTLPAIRYEKRAVPEIELLVDAREAQSPVARLLSQKGVRLRIAQLDIGDYMLPGDLCIERKTAEDLAQSIIDGRLFEQAAALRVHYRRALVLIEGGVSRAYLRVNPEAVRGALLSLAADFGVPWIETRNAEDSATLILHLLRRRSGEKPPPRLVRYSKAAPFEKVQERVLAVIPGIDAVLARRILQRFGSLRQALLASESELRTVEGVGPVLAKRIRQVIDSPYPPPEEAGGPS